MYVQAVPIYFSSDKGAVEYFDKYRGELDLITGDLLHVVLPEKLGPRPDSDVAEAPWSERYPGLDWKQIPCLWVESGEDHFIADFSPEATAAAVSQLVRRLVSALRNATSFDAARVAFQGESIRSRPSPMARPRIFSIHGFRTRGSWQKEIQPICNGAGVDHEPLDFGFFGVLQLLSPWSRDGRITWFDKQYSDLMKVQPPGAPLPSIIAHSFGSYVVAMAMQKYPQIRFHRIILCGSIVKRNFDWDARHIQGQFTRVLNDYGRKDIWVRLAEWVIPDAGSSGYRGFDHTVGGAIVQREHAYWGHSDYFRTPNFKERWLPFIAPGVDPVEDAPRRKESINPKFAITMTTVLGLCAGAAWWLLR